MAKSTFIVPIIPKGCGHLWRERHQESPTARALEADSDGSLSQTIAVEASNAAEAAEEAQRRHPNFTIVRESIQRIG